MRILHTSDWHLGRRLFTKRRYDEMRRFLRWLVVISEQERVDAILLAGDVFDTTTPSPQAQELYFRFLAEIRKTGVRHVVVIAGNHDSPTLLDAPGTLLESFDIHVRSCFRDDATRDVLVLNDHRGNPELIVCAVPFLPEKHLRQALPAETSEDKQRALHRGIAEHYAEASRKAGEILETCGDSVPVVAMGHLFVTGSSVTEHDGIRDLYVGNLGRVDATIFSERFDYVALGHLHVPQNVARTGRIRYSGSPIPMSFGEATQNKSIVLVEFQKVSGGYDDETKKTHHEKSTEKPRSFRAVVETKTVPMFQRLVQLRGDWLHIQERLGELKTDVCDGDETVWLEIDHTGREIIPDLKSRIERETNDTNLEVLRVTDVASRREAAFFSHADPSTETVSLERLTPEIVFRECMKAGEVPENQQGPLLEAFETILLDMAHDERFGRSDE